MTIGQRIQLEREKQELTQEKLAEMAGYADKTSISKAECATDDEISLKRLSRIAKALDVDVIQLMGWNQNDDGVYRQNSELTNDAFKDKQLITPFHLVERDAMISDAVTDAQYADKLRSLSPADKEYVYSIIDLYVEKGRQ